MSFKLVPPTPEELAARGISVAKPAPETEVTSRRARKNNGRFKADDPSTPDVNEAWEYVAETKE